MPRPARTRGISRFFNNKHNVSDGLGQKLVCVNVGGNGDCGFRAAAASMIDNVLVKPRANQELAKKLLEIHAFYFYPRVTSERLMTHAEQLKKGLEPLANRAQFLLELSYALRQIAVDEICAHPETYRGAFVQNHEGTSPEKMRLQHTWVDGSAIAALAQALNITIEVQQVGKGKELPIRYRFNADLAKPAGSSIFLQLQDDHYMPQVHEKDYFCSIPLLKNASLQPKIRNTQDPDLSTILAKIEASDKAMLKEFNQTSKRLQVMIEAGEMSKDKLIQIYIKGMSGSDYLQGRVKYIGLEHGNQHFFEELERVRGAHISPILFPQGHQDEEIVRELIHAISRAMSIGQLDPAVVFEADEAANLRQLGA